MAEYIPSSSAWVREQVELYERTNGAEGSTDQAGLAVIIVVNTGNKSGAVRKTPLMRVCAGQNYVLVGSNGGDADEPMWSRRNSVRRRGDRSVTHWPSTKMRPESGSSMPAIRLSSVLQCARRTAGHNAGSNASSAPARAYPRNSSPKRRS